MALAIESVNPVVTVAGTVSGMLVTEVQKYFELMNDNIEKNCLGVEICGNCRGSDCAVACIKKIIRCNLDEKSQLELEELLGNFDNENKIFDKNKVNKCILLTESAIDLHDKHQDTDEWWYSKT